MTELKKYGALLSLLALLLLAKFVVVPIFEWQAQKVTEIKGQQKKLGKTTSLLTKEDKLLTFNEQVSEQLEAAEKIFYPYQSESTFKLAQQQYFEALINEYNLTVGTFSWQSTSENRPLAFTRYQVQLKLIGKVSALVKFITFIESQEKYIDIADFNIAIKGQNTTSLGSTKNARITLRFYVKSQQNNEGGVL